MLKPSEAVVVAPKLAFRPLEPKRADAVSPTELVSPDVLLNSLVAADTEAENPSLEDKASPAASMADRSPDAPAIEVVASPTAPERPLDPVNAFAVDPTLSASVPFAVVKAPTLLL